MKQLKEYIHETLGIEVGPQKVRQSELENLPLYLTHSYVFYYLSLLNQQLLLAEPNDHEDFSILQIEKNFEQLKDFLEPNVVLLMPELQAYNRQRLIAKGINFIVPGKQLYLPDLLVDLREEQTTQKRKRKTTTLLPSAQFLLIYYIIHRNDNWQIEEHSFKEIAQRTGYSQMAITKAINDLRQHDLVEVEGEKEKFIRFTQDRAQLWYSAEQQRLLTSPVIRRIYVDEKPSLFMLLSNESALPEYTDMNPSRQTFYAIEKNAFYGLQRSNSLINANEQEGPYCLEVWKYNPETLVNVMPNEMSVVDPLSLALSLKDAPDERVGMAIDQIMKKHIW